MLARIGSILVAAWLIGIGLPGAGARADDNHVDLLLVLAADVSEASMPRSSSCSAKATRLRCPIPASSRP